MGEAHKSYIELDCLDCIILMTMQCGIFSNSCT